MKPKKQGIDAYKQTLKNSEKGPETEGFVKETEAEKPAEKQTGKHPPQGGKSGESKTEEMHAGRNGPFFVESGTEQGSGYKKAAHFLMLIGQEEASKVLKHMDPAEIEKIAQEIAATKRMDTEEAEKLLMEFGYRKESGVPIKGGVDTARSMLVSAFGEEKGNELLKKAVPREGLRPFQFLEEYEVEQIASLIKNESEYVVSVILAHLDPAKASKVLENLPPEKLKPVVRRIAVMRKVDYDVIERMEQSLKNKIRNQGKVTTEEINGVSTLANILKHMNSSEGVEILNNLEETDPSLSQTVKEKLFSLEDIGRLRIQDIQSVLREFDEKEIALILKGKSDETKRLILDNVSDRRRDLIQDEIDHLGPRKKDEVEAATSDFLHYIRTMIEEGTIVLPEDEWR